MDQNCLGRLVSLSCGPLGDYQGKIHRVDIADQSIAISNVFHDGKPSAHKVVTFQAADIKSIDFLDTEEDDGRQEEDAKHESAFSTVKIQPKKKGAGGGGGGKAGGGVADKLAAQGAAAAQRTPSFKIQQQQQQQQQHRGSPAAPHFRTSPRKGVMEHHR